MTDRTHPEAGSTHIIRYALELGLLWIDGDGRNKVREALAALDALEAKLASIGAGGVQALSAAPAEADMFWDAEDGERFGNDIDDIISDFGPGDRVKINCAKRMPSIEVLVVADGDDLTYQIVSPTPPAEQQAPKAAPGEPVAWRISCPNEPDLGFWLAEEDGGEGFLSEPLYTRTAPQAAGQDARPCHVFTVRKAGGLTEWEPTTMALALPDGAHALYTLPQPSPHAQADSVTAPAVASEPIAYLYDDGSWTPAKTEEGHKLNNWMISAGSPKIGVHLASAAPLTTLAQATQVGNQQEAREPAFVDVSLRTAIAKAVYQQVRVEFEYRLCSWTALDADEQQRIVDSFRGLYTAPQPTPAPLSDEQIKELIADGVFLGNCKEIVRAIEHAHGITGDGK